MATRRNDIAIAKALAALAQAMAQSNADRHVQENRCGGEVLEEQSTGV
jgi:hypothetical protein